ncbi:MAG: DUF2130 domain-containing protein [Alphaproteobacteria bacterium]|nr:DUF2130 domain-containing protein [Alphaproteobacteria bacterium]
MADPTIKCPNCGTEIKLTESLAAPLLALTKQEYEAKLSAQNTEIARREKAVSDQARALEESRSKLNQQVADHVAAQLQKDRVRITEEEAKKAKLAAATDLEQKTKEVADLQDVLKERDKKLAEAQKSQADLLRKHRELDDKMREVDLTVEKRVQENLAAVRSKAVQEAEESLKLKVAEKEQTIASMSRQIEDLKRKAEQGSQQLQGEVQELELETLLRAKFLFDVIEPVPKGEFGGDVLQRVVSPAGQSCGVILWESKRTKNWSDGWLPKLRDDQRAAKADLSVLVSQAMPKDIETFDLRDSVWVVSHRVIVPMATILRDLLVQVNTARQISVGQQTKAELLYQYLTGSRFRQRVEAIVEAFSSMQDDLAKEKKVMQKQWAKREIQIDNVMRSTVGMYGDLQGIAGKSLQEIEGLGLKAIGFDDDGSTE